MKVDARESNFSDPEAGNIMIRGEHYGEAVSNSMRFPSSAGSILFSVNKTSPAAGAHTPAAPARFTLRRATSQAS